MSKLDYTWDIKNIEYCPGRVGQPYFIEVETNRNGEKDTKYFDIIVRGTKDKPLFTTHEKGELVELVKKEFIKRYNNKEI